VPTLPAIEVRNLYKIFGPQPEAQMPKVRAGLGKDELLRTTGHVLGLSDISFTVRPGQIYVIMGLSGSGKSTLVRHLNRLIEPTAGEVLVGGEDVLRLDRARLMAFRQRRMAMVFQSFGLLPHRTVLENVRYGLDVRRLPRDQSMRTAKDWIDHVGLTGFENRYPAQLSGGMRQRVGLARALANDTDIVLMDEAFSALDPLIRGDMQALLLRLQKELNKTIVFITHDLDEAMRIADRMMVLKDGAIEQEGDPQDIVRAPKAGYVARFVAEINRARTLRMRSILRPDPPDAGAIEVSPATTLEEAIRLCRGDIGARFAVIDDGSPLGSASMADVLAALGQSTETGQE
jgi:glycine betaine/proline transport system ATP-binding protein